VIAPDYPGYGNSSMPSVDEFEYTFDNMASVVDKLVQKIGVTKYSIYLMDYGAPVGFRLAVKHFERVESLIIVSTMGLKPSPLGESFRTLYWGVWKTIAQVHTVVMTSNITLCG
jgi:pimeloyl-ACP methyl ester carboxylesterase